MLPVDHRSTRQTIGIMENQMETTIMDYGYIVGLYKGNIGVILGLHWGYIGDNGKGNGNYYSILGLLWGYIGRPLYRSRYTMILIVRNAGPQNGTPISRNPPHMKVTSL